MCSKTFKIIAARLYCAVFTISDDDLFATQFKKHPHVDICRMDKWNLFRESAFVVMIPPYLGHVGRKKLLA